MTGEASRAAQAPPDVVAPIMRLDNPIRDYAWGSRTAIARLQGRPAPTTTPEAELWIGAHPLAPSRRASDGTPLPELVAAAPNQVLGHEAAAANGTRLPFLLKVLAAAEPLSLQVHPSAEQARRGFAAEEAAGVTVDAPHRVYRDPWPKPELLCALTPFSALCGFRPVAVTLELLDALGASALAPVAAALHRDGDAAMHGVVRDLLTLPEEHGAGLVANVAAAAAATSTPFRAEARWIETLASRYPGDAGVAVAVLLNLVHLTPGDAIHLPPGTPHAYLEGVGIEVMASSDNVLRGGLTRKHVDVARLLEVLDARSAAPPLVQPRPGGASEVVYPTPTPAFRLSCIETAGEPVELDRRGVQILLCTDGAVQVTADGHNEQLAAGASALVTATAERVEVSGSGTVYRATAGDPA